MRTFSYHVARSVADASAIMHEYGITGRVLAGGTDLLSELHRSGEKTPDMIVDISRVEALRDISKEGYLLSIGPLTTHAELMRSDLIQVHAPLLAMAAATIGSPQIRNRGTIGGNIMNAAACADTVPPLIALGAILTLDCVDGERECLLSDFYVQPYQTVARHDEILTEISFPALFPHTRSAFLKLGRRNAMSIARLSVAVVLGTDEEGMIIEARIVPGAALPAWQRITEAEQLLIGKHPSSALFDEAGRVVSAAMILKTGRRWSTEYKEPVLAALVRRALEQCFAAND